MSEEKDDFLREIDELLGDIDDDSTPISPPLANGSTHGKAVEEVDSELADTLKVLSAQAQSNHHQQAPPPKTG